VWHEAPAAKSVQVLTVMNLHIADSSLPPSGPGPGLGRLPRSRLGAGLAHLGLSLAVAALVATLVFTLWYPMPYREAAGGRELFWLVMAVDVVLGPVLTFVVFDPRKSWKALKRDLGVVLLLQLAGLAYGLYTVERARPAVVALEKDRLRVVRSIDLESTSFERAPMGLRGTSPFGPLNVATRPPRDDERLDAIQKGLAGTDIGARPEFWLPPEEAGRAWAAAARPIGELRRMHPSSQALIDSAVAATGRPEDALGYLPVVARRLDFVALVGVEGTLIGYAALDGHR
jgi:hypothetical protein